MLLYHIYSQNLQAMLYRHEFFCDYYSETQPSEWFIMVYVLPMGILTYDV